MNENVTVYNNVTYSQNETAFHYYVYSRAHVVRLGEYDYEDDFDGSEHEDIEVAETILYPDYKYPEAYHDLVLLKLKRKVALQVRLQLYLSICLSIGRVFFDVPQEDSQDKEQ